MLPRGMRLQSCFVSVIWMQCLFCLEGEACGFQGLVAGADVWIATVFGPSVLSNICTR